MELLTRFVASARGERTAELEISAMIAPTEGIAGDISAYSARILAGKLGSSVWDEMKGCYASAKEVRRLMRKRRSRLRRDGRVEHEPM